MRFDFTHGKKANYLVSMYRWSFSDYCYYHTYEDAKKGYEQAVANEEEKGTIISLYDLNKDVRKAYKRF